MNHLEVPDQKRKTSPFMEKFIKYIQDSVKTPSSDIKFENNGGNEDKELQEIEREYGSNPYFKTQLDLYMERFLNEKLLESKNENMTDSKLITLKQEMKNMDTMRSKIMKRILERIHGSTSGKQNL